MQYVPVQSSIGKVLMPCHAARARELVRKGRAVGRFNKGIYYIRLLDRADRAESALPMVVLSQWVSSVGVGSSIPSGASVMWVGPLLVKEGLVCTPSSRASA